MPEYLIVRISARTSPKVVVESSEELLSGGVKRIVIYQTLFPPENASIVERRLKAFVKRFRDDLERKYSPLKLASLRLYDTRHSEKIKQDLEKFIEDYRKLVEELVKELGGDEKAVEILRARVTVFKVYLPDALSHTLAIQTALEEIRGLRDFLTKTKIDTSETEHIVKMLEPDLDDDLRDAVSKVIALALHKDGKVRRRARTFVEKLKNRFPDSPFVELIERLLNGEQPDEAASAVAEKIASQKYAKKVRELNRQIMLLTAELERVKKEAEEEKKKLKEQIEILKQKLKEKDEEAFKELSTMLRDVSIRIKTLESFAKEMGDEKTLKELEAIKIELSDLTLQQEERVGEGGEELKDVDELLKDVRL